MPSARSLALPMTHPAALIATWFGCGLLPGAPGSWGALAALPFAWGLRLWSGRTGLALAAAVLFLIGWWASERLLRGSAEKDPSAIVVDEVAGQWLALVPVPPDPIAYAAGYLLFRAFDIVKPFPVSWADRRLGGGLGVMADDMLAALYVAAVLLLARYILGR